MNWRTKNPDYVYTPPREVRFNGMNCVEIDGGTFSDMANHHLQSNPPPAPKAKKVSKAFVYRGKKKR